MEDSCFKLCCHFDVAQSDFASVFDASLLGGVYGSFHLVIYLLFRIVVDAFPWTSLDRF